MTSSEPDDYVVDCIREMESLGLEEHGFNLTRTYYGDEALWQSFRRDFDAALEKGAPAEFADVMDSLDIVTRIHNDAEFDGLAPAGVSNAFQIFCLDEEEDDDDGDDEEGDGPWSHEMGPGIIRSMCLMVDETSMRSFEATPHVIAVDALLHTGADLGYPGYFKVAIDCLMPNFYAAIGHFDLEKVAAAVDKDGIWRGMKRMKTDEDGDGK